jgi:hypothetical protein
VLLGTIQLVLMELIQIIMEILVSIISEVYHIRTPTILMCKLGV